MIRDSSADRIYTLSSRVKITHRHFFPNRQLRIFCAEQLEELFVPKSSGFGPLCKYLRPPKKIRKVMQGLYAVIRLPLEIQLMELWFFFLFLFLSVDH